jgi:hypothetical protein
MSLPSWGRKTMSQENIPVTTEPAQAAQTPVEKKGAVSESDFARRIAAKQVAYAFQNQLPVQAEAAKPAEAAPVVTEEVVKTTESEAKPEETQTEAVETPAETAEETKEEATEVLSPENKHLDPKLQEILDKRIGKEVAKREKLKAQVAELQAKLAQQPTEVEKEIPVPVPANVPLAEITSMEQLSAYRENLANDIIEAEGLLYAEFPQEGMDTKWGRVTKPQLIGMLTEAKKIERNQIPAREKFLTTRTQAKQTASEEFAFLNDPTHPGYQMAKAARSDPANALLRSYPNSEYLIGLLVEGQLAVQARKAAAAATGKEAAKTATKPKPKPTAGQSEIASDASIQRAPVGVLGQQALQSEITKIKGGKNTYDSKSFAALLAAKQRFRNSQ